MESYELEFVDMKEDIDNEEIEQEVPESNTCEEKVICEFVVEETDNSAVIIDTVTEVVEEQESAAPVKKVVDVETFKEGAIAYFIGGSVYGNATASVAKKTDFPAGAVRIRAKYRKGRHQYMVSHIDDATSVYGWVDCDSLEEIE